MNQDFDRLLHEIRNNKEQKDLENRDVNARFKALGFALLFGFLILSATASFLLDANGWMTGFLGITALATLIAWDQANVRSIMIAKEQDRRYFLSCLRNAQNVDELNRAGLFAYLPNNQGPEWVLQVKAQIANLRRALETEPEWF